VVNLLSGYDFNRVESNYIFSCSNCKKNYIPDDYLLLIKKEWDDVHELNERYNGCKDQINKIALGELNEEWTTLFSEIKYKKDLHPEIIKDWKWGLKTNYSFSPLSKEKFNKKCKNLNIDQSIQLSLEIMLEYTNIYQVMNKLQSKNKTMIKEITQMEQIKGDLMKAKKKMLANAYNPHSSF